MNVRKNLVHKQKVGYFLGHNKSDTPPNDGFSCILKPFFCLQKEPQSRKTTNRIITTIKIHVFSQFLAQKENKGKLQFLIVSFRLFLLFILIVFFFVVFVFSCSNFNCFCRLREWSPLPLLAATAEKHRERKRERQTERERALHVVDFHKPNKLWETVAAKTTITNRQL